MSEDDIKELRRLAEAALLPGGDTPDANRQLVGNTDAFTAWVKVNSEYHQAASPSVILALIDRLEGQEMKEGDKVVTDMIQYLQEFAGKTGALAGEDIFKWAKIQHEQLVKRSEAEFRRARKELEQP